MATDSIGVVIVEDHARTRTALTRALQEADDRISVVESFPDAESMLATVSSLRFDVALIDLGLPKMRGAELIDKLGQHNTDSRCIALSVFDDEKNVLSAVRAGAFGYLLKDEPLERIIESIKDASAGNYLFSSRIAGFLVQEMCRGEAVETLSNREQELARALASGLSYAECAKSMNIAIGTVQSHVKRLYRKLDIRSRKELKAWARRYLPES